MIKKRCSLNRFTFAAVAQTARALDGRSRRCRFKSDSQRHLPSFWIRWAKRSCHLAFNQDIASSNLVRITILFPGCSSVWPEYPVWNREVVRSNRTTQTKKRGHDRIQLLAPNNYPGRLAKLACLSGLNPVMSSWTWEFDPLSLRQTFNGGPDLTGRVPGCDPGQYRFETGGPPQ